MNLKRLCIVGSIVGVVWVAAIVHTAVGNLPTGRMDATLAIQVVAALVVGVNLAYRYRQLSKRDSLSPGERSDALPIADRVRKARSIGHA
jgi:hypothetical protein